MDIKESLRSCRRGVGVPVLHLPPQSDARARIWVIGEEAAAPGIDLRISDDCCEPFGSILALIDDLERLADWRSRPELRSARRRILEARPNSGSESGSPRLMRLMADSVSLAVLRRISRESVYTAEVIDTVALTINTVLRNVAENRPVRVFWVDRVDRPSLKVLTRAMLLLKPADGFRWVWLLACDPFDSVDQEGFDSDAARRQLLRRLWGVLSPIVVRGRAPQTLPGRPDRARSAYELSLALVLQDYESCLTWCRERASSDVDDAESLRLEAIAAVNLGYYDQALDALRCSEGLGVAPARRAHLCYLQGLIKAKREYDLEASDSLYRRGMEHVKTGGLSEHDLSLERAWLHNGLALNHAVRWRGSGRQSEMVRAFEHVRSAFDLVRSGHDSGRVYLRFNLLANMAFLMEMSNQYDAAISALRDAFDIDTGDSPQQSSRRQQTLSYRVGMLQLRGGELAEARRSFVSAESAADQPWFMRERVLRGAGSVDVARGELLFAADRFAEGLELSLGGRSRDGARWHGLALARTLNDFRDRQRADEVIEQLREDEGIDDLVGEFPPASSKLPAYVPEIDLENIPWIDMNRYLVDADRGDGGVRAAPRGK